MILISLWVIVAFVGLCWNLTSLGRSRNDRVWFDRLGFSEAAQEVAYGHVIMCSAFSGIQLIWIVVGVVAYVTAPTPAPPTPPARVLSSSLFILSSIIFTALPIYLEHRRSRTRDREARIGGASREDVALGAPPLDDLEKGA